MTDIDKIINRKTVIPLILILLFILAIFSYVLSGIERKKHWPGYHLLLLDSADNSEISSLLEKQDEFIEIISRYNTDIEYSNYNELKKVKISSLENRFNPADPRLDEYMKSVPLYFLTESDGQKKEIIYIKTELPEKKTGMILDNIITGTTKWEIASLSYSKINYITPLIFLIIIASLVYVKKMKSLFFFFIAILWMLIILKTDISFFYISVINLVFISYIIEIIELLLRNSFEKGKLHIDTVLSRKNLFIAASVFVFSNAVIAVVNFSLKSMILFNTAFIIECSVLFLDLAYSLKKAESYIHRIFSSVPILETNKSRIFDRWLVVKPVHFYIFVLVLTLPVIFFSSGKSSCMLPVPVEIQDLNSGDYFADLKHLDDYIPDNDDKTYLPDISDYFTHLAYQIRLPYETDYSLPQSKEKISISHYFLNKNNFQEEKKTTYLFTDSWLTDNIIRVKETGLTALMFSENTPLRVAVTDTSSLINPVFFGSIYSIFYIVLIFLVIWKGNTGKTNYEKHILPVIKRRKQQAA